jgi:hypothetical protein
MCRRTTMPLATMVRSGTSGRRIICIEMGVLSARHPAAFFANAAVAAVDAAVWVGGRGALSRPDGRLRRVGRPGGRSRAVAAVFRKARQRWPRAGARSVSAGGTVRRSRCVLCTCKSCRNIRPRPLKRPSICPSAIGEGVKTENRTLNTVLCSLARPLHLEKTPARSPGR